MTAFHGRLVFICVLLFYHQCYCKSAILRNIIDTHRLDWLQRAPAQYVPITELDADIWTQAQWTTSGSDLYEATHKYPPKHAFDHLFGEMEDVELYISENDSYAFAKLMDRYQSVLNQTVQVPSAWHRMQEKLGGKYDLSPDDFDTSVRNINGETPDSLQADRLASTGRNGEFLRYEYEEKECVQLKGCNVYPHWRVLYKSQSIPGRSLSCQDIMTQLMPPIYECVEQHGTLCPLMLLKGHFRYAFKLANVSSPLQSDVPLVIRIIRPHRIDDTAKDLQDSVRESILLQHLAQEEEEYMQLYGAQFVSNGEERAFPIVRELGHCVYPAFISVTWFYPQTLKEFVLSGAAALAPLQQLMSMALDIARATELLHNVRGGPFIHKDIHWTQFFVDENQRVLLNDFNDGRIAQYRFPEENSHNGPTANGIFRCRQCDDSWTGWWRAPEELAGELEDEALDVYATGVAIFGLFAGEHVLAEAEYTDHRYLVHDTYRRPEMPKRMPDAVKEAVRWAWTQHKDDRPSARQLRQRLQEIHENLDQYTAKSSRRSSKKNKHQKNKQKHP